jgi:hypothetical protein
VEFYAISKGDQYIQEYVKRIEQMTLAERYRLMMGYSPATPYIAPDVKIPKPAVTDDEIKKYWEERKRDFARPKSAEIYLIALAKNKTELAEGDTFRLQIEKLSEPLDLAEKKYMDFKNKLGELNRKLKNNELDKDTKSSLKKEITLIKSKTAKSKTELVALKKSLPRKKFNAFKKFMQELNDRENRKNGNVRKSEYLGNIIYSNKLKTYENIGFIIKPGNISMLFAGGSGFYAILFVKKRKNIIPHYSDKSTRKRITSRLQEKKRRETIENFLIVKRAEVLPDNDINKELLMNLE